MTMCIRCDELLTVNINFYLLFQISLKQQLSHYMFEEISMEKIFNLVKAINIFGRNKILRTFWIHLCLNHLSF